MLYHLFINIMNSLNNTFGYVWSIRIKVLIVLLAGIVIGNYISVWNIADFFLNVEKNSVLSSKVALMGPVEENPKFTTNPNNITQTVEVVIGYVVFRIFKLKELLFRNLRLILFAYALIAFLLIFFAILLSWWVYLPPSGIIQ